VAKYVNSVSKAGMTTGATTGRHTDRHVWTPFNWEVAGSTHTRSTASNLEQVANLLCAQVNSASYPE